MTRAKIIEIEGIDGVGKTTQCRLLKGWLEKRGQASHIVKDLESTQLGRMMKSILITDEPRTKEAEFYAFLCCKTQLISEVIRRDLEGGINVICDRGVGSFMSYFEALGFDQEFLAQSMAVVLPEFYNPITVLIDLDVDEAGRRNIAKPFQSKFDGMGADFFEKQRTLFLKLAEANSWAIVRGDGPMGEVHSSIIEAIGIKMPEL